MSVSYNSGPIVTNGLIYCVDPANTKCVPGRGVAVTSVIGGSFTGALVGVALSSIGTSLTQSVFNSFATAFTEQNWITISPTITWPNDTAYTLDFYVKVRPNVQSTYQSLTGNGGTNPWLILYTNNTTGTSWQIQFRDINANYTFFNNVTDYNIQNNFANITFVADASRNISFFLNGNLRQTIGLSTSTALTMVRIMGGYASSGNFFSFQGQFGSTLIYNRALSTSEIQQNFQVMRGRYGI
jgi:hypothetical protein